MKRLLLYFLSVILITPSTLPVAANTPAPSVVIRQVQAASATSAKQELIEIENQSDTPVDITGWKIIYTSASGKTTRVQAHFAPTNGAVHYYLNAAMRETVMSQEMATFLNIAATTFKAGMNDAEGAIQLVDAQGDLVDQVGWGTATVNREVAPAPSLGANNALVRTSGDTNNNAADFTLVPQEKARYTHGSIVEYVDICANLDGLQVVPPDGMVLNDQDECVPEVPDVCDTLDGIQPQVPQGYELVDGVCRSLDICDTIEGIQIALPDGYERLSDGQCSLIDVCPELEGVHAQVPDGYEIVDGVCQQSDTQNEDGDTLPNDGQDGAEAPIDDEQNDVNDDVPLNTPAATLRITEVFANPEGVDEGFEYIELYNPNDDAVALGEYQFVYREKAYSLPDAAVPGNGYYTVAVHTLGMTLTNATGYEVALYSGAQEIARSPAYVDAPSGKSWSLIDGEWRYAIPTPRMENTYVDEVPVAGMGAVVKADATLTPCPAGKYRNPLTNRCKNNVQSTTVLQECAPGQYRNPATNRCRSTVTKTTANLKACAADEYRNPATNRCKKIAATTTELKPCKEGYERNPDTNRCRKSANLAVADTAKYPVQPIQAQSSDTSIAWWLFGLLGLGVVGYAIWEWRDDIKRRWKSSENTSGDAQ